MYWVLVACTISESLELESHKYFKSSTAASISNGALRQREGPNKQGRTKVNKSSSGTKDCRDYFASGPWIAQAPGQTQARN